MNLEQEPEAVEREVTQPEGEHAQPEDDDPIVTTVKGADGAELAPVSSVIHYRKLAKELKKENEALKAGQAHVQQQIEDIRPYVEAIKANPRLIEQVQQGTRESQRQTIQDTNDEEARVWAEENGLITAQGELDIARARRQLTMLDKIAERKAAAIVAPIRQTTAQQAAQVNLSRAKAATLQDGSRAATDESIEQVGKMLPPELLSDPNVGALVPLVAAGLDVIMGRRQRPVERETSYSEPAFVETGTRRPAAQVNSELASMLKQVGLSEKDIQPNPKITGRGIALE